MGSTEAGQLQAYAEQFEAEERHHVADDDYD
jgi:hypothetical protein